MLSCMSLLLVIASVAGCGSREREKVAYMMYDGSAVFSSALLEDFDKVARENGQPVEYMDGQNDAETQIAQLEQAVRDGVKIVVLQAVNEEAILPAVERAADSGVFIIAINRFIQSEKVAKVYPDERQAGRLQAEYMESNLPMGACVVYLQGPFSQLGAQQRWEGFKEHCLDKRRDVHLLDRQDGDYKRENGRRIMEEWLEKYPHIDAVVSGNDEMALGALEALKASGKSRSCMISGIDATEEALSAVAAKEMVQTVKQDAASEAESAYRLVEKAQEGNREPEEVSVPFLSVTRDKLSKFYK